MLRVTIMNLDSGYVLSIVVTLFHLMFYLITFYSKMCTVYCFKHNFFDWLLH